MTHRRSVRDPSRPRGLGRSRTRNPVRVYAIAGPVSPIGTRNGPPKPSDTCVSLRSYGHGCRRPRRLRSVPRSRRSAPDPTVPRVRRRRGPLARDRDGRERRRSGRGPAPAGRPRRRHRRRLHRERAVYPPDSSGRVASDGGPGAVPALGRPHRRRVPRHGRVHVDLRDRREQLRPPGDALGPDRLLRPDAAARHDLLRRQTDRRGDERPQQRRLEPRGVPRQRPPELRPARRDGRRDRRRPPLLQPRARDRHPVGDPPDVPLHAVVHAGRRAAVRRPALRRRRPQHRPGERAVRRRTGEGVEHRVPRERPRRGRLEAVLRADDGDPPAQLRLSAGNGAVRGPGVRGDVRGRRLLAVRRTAGPVHDEPDRRDLRDVRPVDPAVRRPARGSVEHRRPVREREGLLRARVRAPGHPHPDHRRRGRDRSPGCGTRDHESTRRRRPYR